MTYFLVQSPYEIFTDLNGDPLENGYIWIGEPNGNPVIDKISVYWDSSFIYPAAQPIRTISGYPSRNGSPGNLFVNIGLNSDFSILIKNKKLITVYYKRNNAVESGGGSVNTTVDTISDLRAIEGYGYPIRVRGHSSIGDNGGRNFEFIDSGIPGTYADDNGRIIVPNGGDGSKAWIIQSWPPTPKDYGAVADGIYDDTAAVQSALTNNSSIHFEAGTYLCDNLTLSASESYKIWGDGFDKTSIKAISTISDDNYLIANTSYINNANTGGNRFEIKGITFNGDGYVLYPFVMYNYFARLHKCRFQKPKVGGYALRISDQTKSGTVCSTTLVENRIDKCRIDGNSIGGALEITANAKVSDGFLTDCLIYNGASQISTLAGWTIDNNHFYAGNVVFLRLSTGTRIENNYFENEVQLNTFIENTISYNSNHHLDDLTVSFGNSGNIAILNDNMFYSSARAIHDYFASSKKLIIRGGAFEASSFIAWSSGSSTGVIILDRIWKTIDSTYISGYKTATYGKFTSHSLKEINSVAQLTATAQTLTWGQSANTIYVPTAGSAGTVTYTLSTTGVEEGAKFRVVRPISGYTNIDVGGLKTLDYTIGQWCDVEYVNGAWHLTAFGNL